MTTAKFFIVILVILGSLVTNAKASRVTDDYTDDLAITTDNRIKTYVYNPNEVYLLVLHYGFQSQIEFAKNEEIQNIVMGDSYVWKINPLENRLFIRPLEKNSRTNLTIITNKRTYQFDIVSKELEEGYEKDLVYLIKFYYPKKRMSAS